MSDHVCFDGFTGPVNNAYIICLLPRMSVRAYGIAAALIAQLVERPLSEREVGGCNPTTPYKRCKTWY